MRNILCIANEHDYLSDGRIFREDELEVGKQYTFVEGEMKPNGATVHLEELPCKYGYQSYLFEELQSYDEQILEDNYTKWLRAELNKGLDDIKEGRFYSVKEVFGKLDRMLQEGIGT